MSNIVLNANRLSYLKPNVNPLNYEVKSFPNGYKHTEKIRSREPVPGIYGKQHKFDIPKGGFLSGLTLEFTASTAGDNTEVENRLGNHLIKRVELRTLNGSKVICITTPEYQDIRMDEMVTNKFENVVEPEPSPFSANSIVCYCPLFMFCFEKIEKYLDTNFVEDLELLVWIADSKEQMGLPAELTELKVELNCNYLYLECASGAKNILGYNMFIESDVENITGTEDTRKLAVDKNVFATHVGLIKDRQLNAIKSFNITSSGYEIVDTTFRLNLCNLNDYRVLSGNQFLTYYWGVYNDRNHNFCYTNFFEMPPTDLTITYDELVGYTRKCFHEYWFVVKIDKYGKIKTF